MIVWFSIIITLIVAAAAGCFFPQHILVASGMAMFVVVVVLAAFWRGIDRWISKKLKLEHDALYTYARPVRKNQRSS